MDKWADLRERLSRYEGLVIALRPQTVKDLLADYDALATKLLGRIPQAAVADMQNGLQAEIVHLYASLKEEREAHAQLQARCFDYGGTGQNVFDDLTRYREDRLVIEAERNTAQAEVLALRTALRKHAVRVDITPSLTGTKHVWGECKECDRSWSGGTPDNESHAPNCLAEQIEKDKGG